MLQLCNGNVQMMMRFPLQSLGMHRVSPLQEDCHNRSHGNWSGTAKRGITILQDITPGKIDREKTD